MEPASLALQADSLPFEPAGKLKDIPPSPQHYGDGVCFLMPSRNVNFHCGIADAEPSRDP